MSFGESPDHPRPQTPDWAALADATAAENRRRKLLWTAAGSVAALTVAGVVAGALVLGGGGGRDAEHKRDREAGPVRSSAPDFSAAPSAAPHPLDYLADAGRDSLPFTSAGFFPGKKAEISGRTYGQTAGDTKSDCAKAAPDAVAKVLARHGCRKLVRGTFQRDGVATTVGVAAFGTTEQAARAKEELPGSVTALQPAKGRKACAKAKVCRRTANAYGRFLYVTLSGFQSGKDVGKKDKAVYTAGDDLAEYTFQRIVSRGRALADASAGR